MTNHQGMRVSVGAIFLQYCLLGGTGFVPRPTKNGRLHATTIWREPPKSTGDGWWNEEKRTFYSVEDTEMSRRKYSKLVTTATPIPEYPISSSQASTPPTKETTVHSSPAHSSPGISTTEEGWWNEENINFYSAENRHRKYSPYKISNLEAHRAPGTAPNAGWWSQNGKPRDFLAPEHVGEEDEVSSPLLPPSQVSATSAQPEQGDEEEAPIEPAGDPTASEEKPKPVIVGEQKKSSDVPVSSAPIGDDEDVSPSFPASKVSTSSSKEEQDHEEETMSEPTVSKTTADEKKKNVVLGGQKASPYVPAFYSSPVTPKIGQGESPYKPALHTTAREKDSKKENPPPMEPIVLKTTEAGWWNEEKRDFFRPRHRHTPYTIRNPELHRAPSQSSNADWWDGHVNTSTGTDSSSNSDSSSPYLPVSYQTPARSKPVSSVSNEEQGWWNEEKKVSYESGQGSRSHPPYQLIPQPLQAGPSSSTEEGWWNEETKVTYAPEHPMNRKYAPYRLIPSGMDEATMRLES